MLRAAASGLLASLLLAIPAAAETRVVEPPPGVCPEETFEQPFTPWFDHAYYTLVPDGGFENGAQDWTRSGADVVPGNQPLRPRTASDAHSLAIRPNGRAISPFVCVNVSHPTIRFFARNTGSPLGLLGVEVIAKTALGRTVALPIGVLMDTPGDWRPAYAMPLVINLFTVTGGDAGVKLRFRAIGSHSSWEIDDVYVDPYSKR